MGGISRDPPGHPRGALGEVLVGDVFPGERLVGFRGGVLRGGGLAETHRAGVALVHAGEGLDEFRGFTHAQDEETGGHRVEGAAVANLLAAELARHGAGLADDVEGGPVLGLVHEEDHVLPRVDRGGGSGGFRKCGGGTGFLPDFGRGASASVAEAKTRNAARRGTANVLRGTREETTSPMGARHARASVAARVDMRR